MTLQPSVPHYPTTSMALGSSSFGSSCAPQHRIGPMPPLEKSHDMMDDVSAVSQVRCLSPLTHRTPSSGCHKTWFVTMYHAHAAAFQRRPPIALRICLLCFLRVYVWEFNGSRGPIDYFVKKDAKAFLSVLSEARRSAVTLGFPRISTSMSFTVQSADRVEVLIPRQKKKRVFDHVVSRSSSGSLSLSCHCCALAIGSNANRQSSPGKPEIPVLEPCVF